MLPGYPPGPPLGPPPSSAGATTGTATTVLVLAVFGLLCCPVTSPIAWVMGARELGAVRRGESPPANRAPAQIGMLLGILGTVLFGLFVLLLGGLAVFALLVEQ